MKVLVVDDHPLILEALERYVEDAEPAWTLVTAQTRDDALRELALHPDCAAVLLDLALPGTRGLSRNGSLTGPATAAIASALMRPGRNTVTRPSRHATIVDSRPTCDGPPSRTSATSFPRSARTCSAVVGLIRP